MDSHSHNPSEMLASHMGERRMQLALELITQDPQGFDAILEDRIEQEPVLDYITDLEIRRDIFVEMQALSREFGPSSTLTGISLGLAMVAPIDGLRRLLDEAKPNETDPRGRYGALFVLRGAPATNGIRACKFSIVRLLFLSGTLQLTLPDPSRGQGRPPTLALAVTKKTRRLGDAPVKANTAKEP